MAHVLAPPNIERPGVVAGFLIHPLIGYTFQFYPGIAFAQSELLRLTSPITWDGYASAQTWFFWNSVSGYYAQTSPIPKYADDAQLGWVCCNADQIIAFSGQRIVVPDSEEHAKVISLGSVLPAGPGDRTYGDIDVPPVPVFGVICADRGSLEISGPSFAPFENIRSISTFTVRVLYRDETAPALAALTADVSAAAVTFPVSNAAPFTIDSFYLIDSEIIKVTAKLANNLTVARAQYDTIGAPHHGPKSITGATNAAPIVITCAGHGRADQDIISVSGILGNTAANGPWEVLSHTADTLSLSGAAGNAAYTSGGILAASQLYAIADQFAIFSFQPEFFAQPGCGAWSGTIDLPNAFILAIQAIVTNAFGNSPIKTNVYAGSAILRTLSGGQIDFEVEGYLVIESNVIPAISVPYTCCPNYVFAYVDEAPVGGDLRLEITVDGSPWAELVIKDGETAATGQRSGRALGPLAADQKLGLNITGVGYWETPGKRLVVRIKL